MKIIEKIELCTGCGACYAICPNNAIEMSLSLNGTYQPYVDDGKCGNCGLCKKACPSLINQKISSKSGIGTFIRCYIGYSVDSNLRWNGSSGGIATSFCVSLFKKGLISGAIVLKDNHTNPLRPLLTFVDNEDELKLAAGSKYCPVQPHFKVKDLINKPGKIAVVGLPCHIWAFRRISELNENMCSKVLVYIGLFCGKCPNMFATTYFIKKYANITEADVNKLCYRGQGWPGKMIIETKQGAKYFFKPSSWYHFSYSPQFMPIRCVLCSDITNERADFSIGDAWGLSNDKIGTSVIITRTERGENLIQNLVNEKQIVISAVLAEAVSNGQGLNSKIKNTLTRTYLWRRVFRQPTLPIIHSPAELGLFSIRSLIPNFMYCMLLYLSNRNKFIRLLICKLSIHLSK